MHVDSTRKDVFKLREKGYSYNLISEKTGISKSTLSGWLARVPYTPNKETLNRIGKARTAAGLHKHQIKISSINKATLEAKKELGSINKRDLFMLGLGIYIGEGIKFGDMVRISNSDPKIIKLSIKWFKEVCGLTDENFVVRLHLYPDNNVSESISYWSKEINIPIKQFQKSSIDIRQGKKSIKKGKLPYGTAHLVVKSLGKPEFGAFLGRKIRAWINEVL
jgi:transcriptional regulator with XRE-family HTH domain